MGTSVARESFEKTLNQAKPGGTSGPNQRRDARKKLREWLDTPGLELPEDLAKEARELLEGP